MFQEVFSNVSSTLWRRADWQNRVELSVWRSWCTHFVVVPASSNMIHIDYAQNFFACTHTHAIIEGIQGHRGLGHPLAGPRNQKREKKNEKFVSLFTFFWLPNTGKSRLTSLNCRKLSEEDLTSHPGL